MKKRIFILIGIALFSSFWFFGKKYQPTGQTKKIIAPVSDVVIQEKAVELDEQLIVSSEKEDTKEVSEKIQPVNKLSKLEAPFVLQAPFANWVDPIFQGACEEASIVMAMNWINGVPALSPAESQKQILAIVEFENSTFGYNTDTDVFAVQKIFQQFFKKQEVFVREDITIVDIKRELQKGNLILVPAFGQALGNPNYTTPGPVEHMLVVTGYDPATLEFITNDPGTRHGLDYRYNEKILFNAIWGYPSGPKSISAPTGTLKKAMIVVHKT